MGQPSESCASESHARGLGPPSSCERATRDPARASDNTCCGCFEGSSSPRFVRIALAFEPTMSDENSLYG